MGSRRLPPGRVIYVCHNCGLVLYHFALGVENREKYAGLRGVSGVTALHGGRCPRCGAPLSPRPLRVEIMSLREYEERGIENTHARGKEAAGEAGVAT